MSVVYSVPKVEPEQVAVNVTPLRDVPPDDLAARVQDRYTASGTSSLHVAMIVHIVR